MKLFYQIKNKLIDAYDFFRVFGIKYNILIFSAIFLAIIGFLFLIAGTINNTVYPIVFIIFPLVYILIITAAFRG